MVVVGGMARAGEAVFDTVSMVGTLLGLRRGILDNRESWSETLGALY
jgi:hypothetical protein